MTRAYNTATTQQNSGGAVAGVTAGKNPFINSAMEIWQRGTSIAYSGAGSPYGPDRFNVFSGNTGTCTRQATGDTTNLPNIQYSARTQRTAGVTSTLAYYFGQSLETVNSIPFAGKTVTFSYYARKGADFTGTNFSSVIATGTGTDQNLLTGAVTGYAVVSSVNVYASLTTTWQRFTQTFAIGSTATQIGFNFYYAPSGTAGANDWFEVTGIQLEVGSVATPFSRSTGTYATELAACQRYFLKYGGNQAYETFPGVLLSYSTTQGEGPIALKQTMRTTPTVAFSTLKISDVATYNIAVTNLTITTNTSGPDAAYLVFTVASGASSGKTNLLRTNDSTAGYLTFSAEL